MCVTPTVKGFNFLVYCSINSQYPSLLSVPFFLSVMQPKSNFHPISGDRGQVCCLQPERFRHAHTYCTNTSSITIHVWSTKLKDDLSHINLWCWNACFLLKPELNVVLDRHADHLRPFIKSPGFIMWYKIARWRPPWKKCLRRNYFGLWVTSVSKAQIHQFWISCW